jgi:signal transduction histidine kinase
LKESDGSIFGKLAFGLEMSRFDRRLADMGASVASLTHDISHEVRNAEYQIKSLGITHPVPALQALSRMCMDIREYAKMSGGARRPIEVKELLDRVSIDIDQEARDAGVDVDYNLGASLPLLYGNDYLLRHAITDLVRNAIRATVASPVASVVHVRVIGPGDGLADWVIFEVADEGEGLSDKLAEFVNSDPTFDGMGDHDRDFGLGLLLATLAAREHAGKITYRVEDGKNVLALSFPVPSEIMREQAKLEFGSRVT